MKRELIVVVAAVTVALVGPAAATGTAGAVVTAPDGSVAADAEAAPAAYENTTALDGNATPDAVDGAVRVDSEHASGVTVRGGAPANGSLDLTVDSPNAPSNVTLYLAADALPAEATNASVAVDGEVVDAAVVEADDRTWYGVTLAVVNETAVSVPYDPSEAEESEEPEEPQEPEEPNGSGVVERLPAGVVAPNETVAVGGTGDSSPVEYSGAFRVNEEYAADAGVEVVTSDEEAFEANLSVAGETNVSLFANYEFVAGDAAPGNVTVLVDGEAVDFATVEIDVEADDEESDDGNETAEGNESDPGDENATDPADGTETTDGTESDDEDGESYLAFLVEDGSNATVVVESPNESVPKAPGAPEEGDEGEDEADEGDDEGEDEADEGDDDDERADGGYGPVDAGDAPASLAPFGGTTAITPGPNTGSVSPPSLAGKIRVESQYAAATSVAVERNSSTNYTLVVDVTDENATNVTFYVNVEAISASQDVEAVKAKLDSRTVDFTEAEARGSAWIAVEIDHFSERRLTFTNSEFEADETVAGGAGPPRNLDGDLPHEDVDGDGEYSLADVFALAFLDDGSLTRQQVAALDHDGDGDVDVEDAFALAFDG
jgi:hypothetical protein